MKRLALFLTILLTCAFFITCTKTHLDTASTASQGSNSKVNPDVPYCGTDEHWDFYLGKCVPDCPSGQHNDSITGACVVDGGGGTITVITNPNNPEDYFGQKHNNGCSVLLGEVNGNSQTLYADILHYTKLYLKSQSYDTTVFNTWYNYAVSHGYYAMPDDFLTDHPDSLTNRLYRNGLLSSTGKSYVNSINAVIDNTIGSNDPSAALYNSAASQLITIENNISNDSRLSSSEKQGLLSMSATARYSGAYWGNYILNGGGGENPSNQISPNLFKKGWWKSFWHADAGGALAGGIAGIFTGGIILSAIGGGLGASVANLFGLA